MLRKHTLAQTHPSQRNAQASQQTTKSQREIHEREQVKTKNRSGGQIICFSSLSQEVSIHLLICLSSPHLSLSLTLSTRPSLSGGVQPRFAACGNEDAAVCDAAVHFRLFAVCDVAVYFRLFEENGGLLHQPLLSSVLEKTADNTFFLFFSFLNLRKVQLTANQGAV